MLKNNNCISSEKWKPFGLMIIVNLALGLVNLALKKVLNEGMSFMTIITYRQLISAFFMAPVAFFYERKNKPQANIICLLFLSALIGVTFTQYLFLLGLKYTSATFACAFINTVPVFTFIMALPFGTEKVKLRSMSGKAKVLGTCVCIGGALTLALYKGIPLINPKLLPNIHHHHLPITPSSSSSSTNNNKLERWVMGSILLTAGCLLWSSWFLIQSRISKRYPFQYSSTAILSLFSAIQSALLNFIINTNHAIWTLSGNLQIFTVIYAGLVGSGLCYVAMSWCVKQKGPVFTAAFTPLLQIFAALLGFPILHEQIYLGSVAGSAIVIVGMYILLWGKSKEEEKSVVTNKQLNQEADDVECHN